MTTQAQKHARSSAQALPVRRHRLTSSRRRAGFTLTELMVAVAVLVIVIIATSKIFSTAGQITGIGQATQSMIQEAAAIEQQIRNDIAKLSNQGFFAIHCVSVRNDVKGAGQPLLNPNLPFDALVRADQLVFFATGVEASQTSRITQYSSHKGEGTASRIYYGHAFQLPAGKPYVALNAAGDQGNAYDAPPNVAMVPWQTGTVTLYQTLFSTIGAQGPDDLVNIFTATANAVVSADQPEARRWLLTKQSVLLVDDDSQAPNTNAKTVYLGDNQTGRSIFFDGVATHPRFGWTREVRNGRVDAVASQLSDIRNWITHFNAAYRPWSGATGLPGGNQRGCIINAIYYPRAERKAPSMHRVDQALTNHVIGSACSSFTVDWTYDDGVGFTPNPNVPATPYLGVIVDRTREHPWFGLADASRSVFPYSLWTGGAATILPINTFPNNIESASAAPPAGVTDYYALFGYNQTKALDASGNPDVSLAYTPFPSSIRITMTLHDPDGKLEAGRQFQFVVDLPKQVR